MHQNDAVTISGCVQQRSPRGLLTNTATMEASTFPFNLLVPFVSDSNIYQACGITIQPFLNSAKTGIQGQ